MEVRVECPSAVDRAFVNLLPRHSEGGQEVSHPVASEAEGASLQEVGHRVECAGELLEFVHVAGGDVVCAGPVWHNLYCLVV